MYKSWTRRIEAKIDMKYMFGEEMLIIVQKYSTDDGVGRWRPVVRECDCAAAWLCGADELEDGGNELDNGIVMVQRWRREGGDRTLKYSLLAGMDLGLNYLGHINVT